MGIQTEVKTEVLIESGSLIDGLERVIREAPPPQPDYYGLSCIFVSAGTVRMYFQSGVGLTIPFLHGSYEVERATHGLTELLMAEPSLTDRVLVKAGEDPSVGFDYERGMGMFSNASAYIYGWDGAFSISGWEGPFLRILDKNRVYDLRTAAKWECQDPNPSNAAIAKLRDRIILETSKRDIPVRDYDSGISFGEHIAVIDEAFIRAELTRKPKSFGMYSERRESLLKSVRIFPEQLIINLGNGRESLQTQEALQLLRGVWEGQLQDPIEAATGISLLAELKQPWKVTYGFKNIELEKFDYEYY